MMTAAAQILRQAERLYNSRRSDPNLTRAHNAAAAQDLAAGVLWGNLPANPYLAQARRHLRRAKAAN